MTIGVLGTGAFGVSLAMIMRDNGHVVKMWTKFEEEKLLLLENRESPYLKGIKIADDIAISTSLRKTIKDADLILVAVPSQAVAEVAIELKKHKENYQHVCIATKGIDEESCLFVYDVLKLHLRTRKIGLISGPTFAIDVANRVPIGMALGSKCKSTIFTIKAALENYHIKLRPTADVLGIEICGSIKNIIAIANGMLEGMGLPISTQAMMITEAIHDIKRLIKTLGGNNRTVLSFAGFGDILLTSTSVKSRNFRFGQLIGKGASKAEIEEYVKTTTVEGLNTLKLIRKLLKNKNVRMPIIDIMYDIIYKDASRETLIKYLMNKEL